MVTAPGIAILLSIYNGENFLKSQLDSILAQRFGGWVIAWRDDGSSDDSVAVMQAFAAGAGAGRCVQSASSGPHLGAAGSFLQLLAECGDFAFVAFADQDDRWLPEKLQRGMARLVSDEVPMLYCSRQVLTDDDFSHPTLSVKYEGRPGFPASLTQNIATGNTIVMNRAAARLVASIPAPEASPHDWWSYIIVSACGGAVIYDPEPTMLYRQHAKNLIGSQFQVVTRAIAALERGPGIYLTMMRRHVERLQAYRHRLAPQAAADLEVIAKGLAGGRPERLAALRLPEFKRATRLENFLFRIWFLLQ